MLGADLEEELGISSEVLPPLPATQGLCLFQSSSFSSITDSTMSLNIITVTLNMGEASAAAAARGARGSGAGGRLFTHPAPQRGTISWASASWARATTGAMAASTSAPS